MIDTGNYFAHAFYCDRLHAEQPASTFSFSKQKWSIPARGFLGESGIINILWQGGPCENREDVARQVRKFFPRAKYKGVLTDRNFLMMPGAEPCPVVGEPVLLDKETFENGAIRRPQRPVGLRLIVDNDKYEPRSA